MEDVAKWVLVGVFLLVGMGAVTLGLLDWFFHRKLLRYGVRVEGRVVEVKESRVEGGRTYHPVVDFEDEQGQTHRLTSHSGHSDWDDLKGALLDVLYPKGRPDLAAIEIDSRGGSKILIGGGVATLAVTGIVSLIQPQPPR